MNEVFRSEAATRPTIDYFDTFSAFAGADGAYAAHLPDTDGRMVRVRDPDGVHFTPDGADWVAEAVLRMISQTWDLSGT